MTTVGMVLAAGEGKRFGGPKAPYEFEGERLVDRAVRHLNEAGCEEVFVVLGAWVGDVPGSTVVINSEWESGVGSSLRAGLKHIKDNSTADRVVISLVDMPGVTPEALRRIANHADPVVVATFDGKVGHPVSFHRDTWKDLIDAAKGHKGARKFLKNKVPASTKVEVGDVASGEDLTERPA